MRKKLGALLMLLGIVLILAAASLLWNNQQEDDLAMSHSRSVLPALREEIQLLQETIPLNTDPEFTENIPVDYFEQEDLFMTEMVIDGYAYIGYLTIPDLGLELPVMSGWDDQRLKISPCRYSGTLKGEDLVVMAHSYKAHFRNLSKLAVGSQIQFMDMNGIVWNYQVVAMDVLPATAIEEMTAGEYDLTLFTCASNRTDRITVRCEMQEK